MDTLYSRKPRDCAVKWRERESARALSNNGCTYAEMSRILLIVLAERIFLDLFKVMEQTNPCFFKITSRCTFGLLSEQMRRSQLWNSQCFRWNWIWSSNSFNRFSRQSAKWWSGVPSEWSGLPHFHFSKAVTDNTLLVIPRGSKERCGSSLCDPLFFNSSLWVVVSGCISGLF